MAAGQFQAIEDHLRALRDVSEIANKHSGKVVHEITPDGQVYYGANTDPGNETVKFPSAVAVVWRWTGDNTAVVSRYQSRGEQTLRRRAASNWPTQVFAVLRAASISEIRNDFGLGLSRETFAATGTQVKCPQA